MGVFIAFSNPLYFTAPEEILSQPVCLNSEIKIGGKPVLYQHWAKAVVLFINAFKFN
jgi:hypothetical protein